jgi:hypothetical protein
MFAKVQNLIRTRGRSNPGWRKDQNAAELLLKLVIRESWAGRLLPAR